VRVQVNRRRPLVTVFEPGGTTIVSDPADPEARMEPIRHVREVMTKRLEAAGWFVYHMASVAIEGIGVDGEPHPMQRAFVEHDAFQCGYCTPGQIMSAIALIEEGNASTDEAIAEFMSGNICRCAAYPNIRAAIREVRDAAA